MCLVQCITAKVELRVFWDSFLIHFTTGCGDGVSPVVAIDSKHKVGIFIGNVSDRLRRVFPARKHEDQRRA